MTDRRQQRFDVERTQTVLTEGWTRLDGSEANFAPESTKTSREMFEALRCQGLAPPGSDRKARNKLKAARKAQR